MFRKELPSYTRLLECLYYDPEHGSFTWRTRPAHTFDEGGRYSIETKARIWNGRHAGKPAFANKTSAGYYCGMINSMAYQAHRVAWKLYYGCEPDFIDHINRDGLDNRIRNLRSVSHSTNTRNHRMRKDNTSGYSGVSISKDGKWQARIGVCREGADCRVSLGVYDTKDEAGQARILAERELGYIVEQP